MSVAGLSYVCGWTELCLWLDLGIVFHMEIYFCNAY